MSRLFPNPKRTWTDDKYRSIIWKAEKEKQERKKQGETRMTKEEFMKKWNQERKEDDGLD